MDRPIRKRRRHCSVDQCLISPNNRPARPLIASWLSVVEELSALVTANLQRATRLRQSILQQAFSGAL